MTERDLLDQLDDALSGDIEHGVVRVWAWVAVVHGGSVDLPTFRRAFPDAKNVLVTGLSLGVFTVTKTSLNSAEWPERSRNRETGACDTTTDVGTSSPPIEEVRKEEPPIEGRKFRQGGTIRPPVRKKKKGDAPVTDRLSEMQGREKIEFAFANPRSRACQEVIRKATQRFAKAYVEIYQARTGRNYWPNMVNKNAHHFRVCARWCSENGLRYKEWIRYCDNTYRARSTRSSFPSPANMAGTWVCDAWIEDQEKKKTPHVHAGHTYVEASKGLRPRLTSAGFDVTEHDDEMLEYFESCAKEKRTLPDIYTPESNEDHERIIDWLVTNEGS